MNPKAYFGFLTADGQEMLKKCNEESKDWLL
jgi:hypothetical protein